LPRVFLPLARDRGPATLVAMPRSRSGDDVEGLVISRKGRDYLNAFKKDQSAGIESERDLRLIKVRRKRPWTYKSLGHGIRRVDISWRDFVDFPSYSGLDWGFDSEEYIWRGQMRSSWLLLPTLDRLLNKSSRAAFVYQRAHLAQFKSATRGRRGSNPPRLDDENDWWALGQHHGLRTPLLDWAESPFVAAYFAYLEPSPRQQEARGVYALNTFAVERMSARLRLRANPTRRRPPAIEMIRPLSDENPRLVSQSGLFTRGPDGVDVEAWVRRYFSKREMHHVLVKFMLPNSDRREALACLNQMNINHLTLFPDLTGASRYCNLLLERHGDDR
jgi:FRG domain-containing protein